MDNNFTLVIRSSSKENTADNSNDCTIRFTGLPTQFRFFEATVSALHVSTVSQTISTSTFELRQEGLNMINGIDTKNNILRTVAFSTYNNGTYPQGPYQFNFENCNGRSIRFQLYQDNGLLLQNGGSNYNLPWILVLNLVGYN